MNDMLWEILTVLNDMTKVIAWCYGMRVYTPDCCVGTLGSIPLASIFLISDVIMAEQTRARLLKHLID